MKELLEKVDNILSMIEVKGDSVIYLAQARNVLKTAYDKVKGEQNGTNS